MVSYVPQVREEQDIIDCVYMYVWLHWCVVDGSVLSIVICNTVQDNCMSYCMISQKEKAKTYRGT